MSENIKTTTKNIIIALILGLFIFGAIHSFGYSEKCNLKTDPKDYSTCSVEELKMIKTTLSETKIKTDNSLTVLDSILHLPEKK